MWVVDFYNVDAVLVIVLKLGLCTLCKEALRAPSLLLSHTFSHPGGVTEQNCKLPGELQTAVPAKVCK